MTLTHFDTQGQAHMVDVSTKAITAREYSELMALNLITAVLVLLGNFIADMLYTVADPRIRVSKGKGE